MSWELRRIIAAHSQPRAGLHSVTSMKQFSPRSGRSSVSRVRNERTRSSIPGRGDFLPNERQTVLVQLDDYADERGAFLGQTLSIVPGLSFILPASRSFRHPARMKELTEVCPKCGHRLRMWAMMRLSTDHTTPRRAFVECPSLLVGFEPDAHDLKKIVAAWSNLRRFQDRALNEFKRTQH